jgi:hypothetical protein
MVVEAFPAETRKLAVFDDPFGEEPNEETAYLLVHESDAGDGEMNNLDKRPLLDVQIVGKRLVIEQGADNHVMTFTTTRKTLGKSASTQKPSKSGRPCISLKRRWRYMPVI